MARWVLGAQCNRHCQRAETQLTILRKSPDIAGDRITAGTLSLETAPRNTSIQDSWPGPSASFKPVLYPQNCSLTSPQALKEAKTFQRAEASLALSSQPDSGHTWDKGSCLSSKATI